VTALKYRNKYITFTTSSILNHCKYKPNWSIAYSAGPPRRFLLSACFIQSSLLRIASLTNAFHLSLFKLVHFRLRLTQVILLAQSLLLSPLQPSLFMQPESSAVSQHTPPVDSSQANLNTTQHGNDLEDGAVSGPLLHEETRDSPVAGSTVPTLNRPFLSEDGATPPSPAQRVIEHENAGSPRRRDTGFRVVKSSGHSQVPMESLPNGMPQLSCMEISWTSLTSPSRGSYPYPVASASPYLVSYDPGVPPIPLPGYYSPCVAGGFFALLPGAPGSRACPAGCIRRDGACVG